MRRRDAILSLGGAAILWPSAARAQHPNRPTVGFLGVSSRASWRVWIAAFVQRLDELGWTEGRSVTIEYRWAEGRPERMAEIAAEFVKLKVNVIVTAGSAVHALTRATSDIPIVLALASAPVGVGLVKSLSRPGANVTGLSTQQADLAGKRVELLREVVPGLRRLAVLANVGSREALVEVRVVHEIATKLGVEVVRFDIQRADDIAPGFEILRTRADALYVIIDGLTSANRVAINTLALSIRLPAIWLGREYLDGGALMSYGPSYPDLFRRAADYVDKILRGAKPADLPMEQPTRFELVVSLSVAKELGLKIPESVLLRADYLIE